MHNRDLSIPTAEPLEGHPAEDAVFKEIGIILAALFAIAALAGFLVRLVPAG